MKRDILALMLLLVPMVPAPGCYTKLPPRPPSAERAAPEQEPQRVLLPDDRLDGDYSGSSILTDESGTHEGHVRFSFHAGTYHCGGDNVPTGMGDYTDFGLELVLEDRGAHTANFDWTLILSGHFAMQRAGSLIQLSQRDERHGRSRQITLTRE